LDILSKHTQLAEIRWPVFKLGEKKPEQQEGLVFYYTEYVDNDNIPSINIRLVDDAALSGKTLGLRRLQLKTLNEKLYPIRTAIYFLADLIKLGKSTTWFIDSNGKVFQYEKNTRAKLTTRKIKNVFPVDAVGCVLELAGVPHRFKAMTRPKDEQIYARVLQLGMIYIFYGYCEAHKADSWRMI